MLEKVRSPKRHFLLFSTCPGCLGINSAKNPSLPVLPLICQAYEKAKCRVVPAIPHPAFQHPVFSIFLMPVPGI
jgi:hypothetical protein